MVITDPQRQVLTCSAFRWLGRSRIGATIPTSTPYRSH